MQPFLLEGSLSFLFLYHFFSLKFWKFFSLKSFFGYFYRTGQIKTNPTLSMQVPKIPEKEIIRLNQDEIKTLLKEAESGSGLSQKQKHRLR